MSNKNAIVSEILYESKIKYTQKTYKIVLIEIVCTEKLK